MKIDLRRGGTPASKTPEEGMAQAPTRMPEYQTARPTGTEQAGSRRDTPAPKIMDWIITGAVYLLTFLIPLFVLPNVPSALELNKQVLLVLLGGIAFLAWIGKLAWEGRIRIKKNFLLVPVLILLIVLSLSTVFSVYRDQSIV